MILIKKRGRECVPLVCMDNLILSLDKSLRYHSVVGVDAYHVHTVCQLGNVNLSRKGFNSGVGNQLTVSVEDLHFGAEKACISYVD